MDTGRYKLTSKASAQGGGRPAGTFVPLRIEGAGGTLLDGGITTRRPKNSKLWMWVACLTLLFGTAPAMTQSAVWTAKAPLPEAREDMAAGVVDGKIYLAGGFSLASGYLASTLVYDPASDSWERRAALPSARAGAAAAVADGILYVIGGYGCAIGCYQSTLMADVVAYNPKTDTWTPRAPMPGPRAYASAAVIGGIIYVTGGFDELGNDLTALIAYNPKTNTWSEKAPMPTGRFGAASGVIGGIFYVACGRHHGPPDDNFRVLEAYDPKTDTWSTGVPPPTERAWGGAGVLDGKLYLAGGTYELFPWFANRVESYDPKTNSWWSEPSMPTARHGVAAAVVDDTLYILGGVSATYPPSVVLSLNEAFSPFLPVAIEIKPNTINLRSNEKIKVAILGSSTFDATSVVPDSVKLSGALPATEANGTPLFSFDDVNDDGILDLVVSFRARDLQLTKADTQVVLKGQTFAGQLIKGVASVRIAH